MLARCLHYRQAYGVIQFLPFAFLHMSRHDIHLVHLDFLFSDVHIHMGILLFPSREHQPNVWDWAQIDANSTHLSVQWDRG